MPGDYSTIQDAFYASNDGDTILVQTGTYYEHLYFANKNVVLGSLFITTGDTAYIPLTIFDGSNQDNTVNLTSGIDTSFVLAGFTIQKGYTVAKGGCIIIQNSATPTLRNLKIINNTAANGGGGLYINNGSGRFIDLLVSGNTVEDEGEYHGWGGGIFVWYADWSLRP